MLFELPENDHGSKPKTTLSTTGFSFRHSQEFGKLLNAVASSLDLLAEQDSDISDVLSRRSGRDRRGSLIFALCLLQGVMFSHRFPFTPLWQSDFLCQARTSLTCHLVLPTKCLSCSIPFSVAICQMVVQLAFKLRSVEHLDMLNTRGTSSIRARKCSHLSTFWGRKCRSWWRRPRHSHLTSFSSCRSSVPCRSSEQPDM